jgi:hypothetical protein
MSYQSNFDTLDSRSIPYEIRRNPINIYNCKNILYNKIQKTKKTNRYGDQNIINEEFLYNNNELIFPNDCKIIFEKNLRNVQPKNTISKKVYLYKVMSLNNIGHFFIDNLIPIIKMIFIDQQILKNSAKSVNRDNYIIFLRSHEESNKCQTIINKHREYFLPYTQHEVKFLSYYPDKTLFTDVVISTLGIGKSISFTNWYKYENHEMIDESINKNFVQLIKKIYFKFHNIEENKNPNKIVILSRKNAKHRRVRNERELVNALNSRFNNVELIKFEKFNLKDELDLLNNVSLFISPHGAGIISSFFIPSKSLCLMINPRGFSFIYDFPVIYQKYLERLNIDIYQYENDDSRDLDLKHIYRNRDKHFYINIPKIIEIIEKHFDH